MPARRGQGGPAAQHTSKKAGPTGRATGAHKKQKHTPARRLRILSRPAAGAPARLVADGRTSCDVQQVYVEGGPDAARFLSCLGGQKQLHSRHAKSWRARGFGLPTSKLPPKTPRRRPSSWPRAKKSNAQAGGAAGRIEK